MNFKHLLLVAAILVCGLFPPVVSKAQNQLAGTHGGSTFYSMQKTLEPPLPYNRWPELPVVPLGDGIFLIDDRSVDYAAWEAENALLAALLVMEAGPQEGGQQPLIGADYGCALWLDLAAVSTNTALLTLHNTRPGQSYQIWGIGDLNLTNWTVVTNLVGNSADTTLTFIPIDEVTNLFLRASEDRDYAIVTNSSFKGLGYADIEVDVPDTMGAVGPNHFVELLNGQIAVYDKSGTKISQTNTLGFFAMPDPDGSTNPYPRGTAMRDQRILFDHQAQRWVACGIDLLGSWQAILAVSHDDMPTNLVSGWSRHLVRVRREGLFSDFTTLGLDANGIYVTVLHLGNQNTNAGHTVVAIKKPEIYQGQFLSSVKEIGPDPPVWTIQPAVNFDPVPTTGHAWFVAKGPPEWSTNSYQGGALFYRRLQWQGTNTVWADTNWVADSATNYRNYYDLEGTNVTVFPDWYTGVMAPQAIDDSSFPNGIDLHVIGSRFGSTVIRNGYLWTCQTVGLNHASGVYDDDQSGGKVNRSAVQWLRFGVNGAGGSLSYSAHGRIYSDLGTNAYYYHFPSLAVNCAGDMALGFSGSSATNYINAFYALRLANGLVTTPRLLHAATNSTTVKRWGDYSATTTDPSDDWSFWTVQEYAGDVLDSEAWTTRISKFRVVP